jgi:hypothetical protein
VVDSPHETVNNVQNLVYRIKLAYYNRERRTERPCVLVVGEAAKRGLEDLFRLSSPDGEDRPIGPIEAWRFMGMSVRLDPQEADFRLEAANGARADVPQSIC